jgi:hypothetical protein
MVSWWRLVLVAVLVLPSAAGAEPPKPGATLGADTAASAEGLLPPELLARYRAGEYRSEVAAWPDGPPWEDAFRAASEKNAARLAADAKGTIVEREGGAPARGIYGLPFRIDPSEPTAGVAVIWNAYYALWRIASTHDVLALQWVGKRGLEREAVLESHTLYWEGAPPGRAPRDNPQDLASQQRAIVTAPADLNGTASLVWRFRGAEHRDQAWTYIPALRRVRAVTPANRSDGFLGSDLSQDDGAFFDGKPEDFAWKLVGRREALVLADPVSLTNAVKRKARPDGGIAEEWPVGTKIVGHQDPAWRGVPWAPLAPVRVRRPVWVVEATPRDPYYLFSRIELTLDAETFQGVGSRKFDAQGTLLRSLEFLSYASQPIDVGGETLRIPAASMGLVVAENTKAGRATIAGIAPPGDSVHERRVPLDPGLFSLEKLSAGK